MNTGRDNPQYSFEELMSKGCLLILFFRTIFFFMNYFCWLLFQMQLKLSLLPETGQSWNMTMLLSFAMHQVIHPHRLSGPKKEAVQFYIQEKPL